jgi:ArsR family transcriptional regulator
MMITPNLAQEIIQLQADFCSALSDPTRLLLLYSLAERPHNVTELAAELEVSQPTVSRHLKVLRERGLVQTSRSGTNITYSITDRRLIDAIDILRTVMRDRIAYHANLMEEIIEQ